MKTSVVCLVGLFTSMAALLPADLAAQSIFPDKNLEKVVRKYVFEKRYTEDPITEEDVKYLSVIKGVEAGIENLAGLEKCYSLAELDLRGNAIVDLAPLSGLKYLQSVSLSDNRITDIAPLAGLTRMQYLELSGNQVEDIGPLANLTAMRSLYLSGNKVKDISVVRGMEKIWSLYLDGNQVTDLSPIRELRFLSSLDLKGNGIEDLSSIANFQDLNFLFLQENRLTDLTVLVDMAKRDMEGRRNFAPFWRIYLRDNPLSDAARNEQVPALQQMGARIDFEY
ncbi:MAG TPA: leucine-rich repeat domain-containing protein [Planctomycetaceae bacterium]|nr:leucine-rich repeat domain-containing protein [Planctomycetaceae bacterium]HRE99824.1 leucine-rich repeat domain-containing protein [Pirellulaceae bacterium]